MSEELKPCPFCGSTDVGGAQGVVHCYSCEGRICSSNTENAVLKWNTRVELDEHHPKFEALVRSFWRRIEPYKNRYEKELPKPLPDEFRVHMNTAMCVFR